MKTLSFLSLFLLFLVPGANAQSIDVAVVEAAGGGYGGGAAVVAQLNDDTFFDFTATLVDASGVDSAAELASYDAVVLGGSGYGTDPIWSVAMANAVKAFVEGGGGLLMTGWGHWNSFSAGPANVLPAAILDTVVPGDIDNSYTFISSCCLPGTTMALTDLSHPITQDLPASISYGVGSYLEYNRHPLQPGDVSLGIPSGLRSSQSGHALIYRENMGAGNGRAVYLGALHFAAVNANRSTQLALRSGPGDQLFEQALAWAGTPVDADADGDGVLDSDDFCPGTVIPEGVPTVQLNPNHWALIDGGLEFDTLIKGKGKGPNRSYITEDTAGCSCEQIIEAQGLGYGLTKHGCSIDVMDDWVELVTP
jgi:hypothetical protein